MCPLNEKSKVSYDVDLSKWITKPRGRDGVADI